MMSQTGPVGRFLPVIFLALLAAAAFAVAIGAGGGLGAGAIRVLPLIVCAGLLCAGLLLFVTQSDIRTSMWGGVALAMLGGGLFGLLLASKWQAAFDSDVLQAGVLPLSDAKAYFEGALEFLHKGELTPWATRRPFTSLQLATLLGMSGTSLRFAVAVLTLLGGASVLVTIAVLAARLGGGAGAVAAAVLIPFYFPTVGTLMSENLGLALGGCGFVLMWFAVHGEGAGQRSLVLFAAGLWLMGLGLAARAGAMFVLPALVLYAGWRFRRARRFSFPAMGAALAAVVFAFALNAAAVAGFGAAGAEGFSNFAFTLYGLVSGGHGWIRFHHDFPELASLPEGVQTKEAYRLALAHLAAHPLDLLRGMSRRYNEFLFNARWFRIEGIGALRYVLVVIGLAGFARVVARRTGNTESFILAGTIGIWLSVPFIGDGGIRVHAATMGFTAALAGIGAAALAGWFGRPMPASRNPAGLGLSASLIAGVALALLLVAPFYRGP